MNIAGSQTVIVPFADLYAQYLTIQAKIDQAIADVIAESAFIRGRYVETFEAEFAKATNARHCISCANGTDAIYIAMIALGIRRGDEVIVPAMSWISTSETVTQAGGTVVFCDIDPVTYTIDTERLADLVTDRTVGIIPVHLYGQPARMDAVMDIASRHGLWVIEDCAQAHLAEIDGRQIGTFGNAATFSFYPGKNLGAMGDAGAVNTPDPALANRMAMFARHGGLRKGDHQIEGINSRLDGLQAAILSVKLPHLPAWTARRRQVAADYSSLLADITELTLPAAASENAPVWHLYVVQHPRRDALAAHLKSQGIQTSINYPRALPQLPCYADMGHKPEDFAVAQRLADCGLALPIFPEITDAQLSHVGGAIRSFCKA